MLYSGEGGVCVCVKLCLVCYTVVREVIEVHANDYMMKLVEQTNLHFIVTRKARETGQIVMTKLTVAMRKPKLIVKVCDPALPLISLSHSFLIISMFVCLFIFFPASLSLPLSSSL